MRRNNLFFRSMAVVLCLAMLLGFVPGGIFGSVLKASAVEDTSAKLYLNAEELTALKSYITDDSKNAYGFSWKDVYEDLIYSADTYLTEEKISVSMNTGKSYQFPAGDALEDPSGETYREGYIEASKKNDGTLFEEPYTGFGALLMGSLKTRLETLSLAYLLTKDTKYSDLAITYVMEMVEWEAFTDANWLAHQSNKTTDASQAWAVQGIVAVYDMCGDLLSADQKAVIVNAIMTKGLAPLDTSVVKITKNGNAQMMFIGGMLTGIAAIEADVPEEKAAQLATYKANAIAAAKVALDRYATTSDTEGHYYTGYGLEYLLPGLAHLYRAGGENLFAENAFLTDILPEWTVMFAAPNTLTHPNYSDASVGVQMQLPMAVVSKVTGDPLANYFLLGAAKDGLTAFEKLVYLDVDPAVDAPEGYVSVIETLGYGALRTGFANGDMMLTLKANDSQMGSHNHYDQNSIMLNVGGSWLMKDPGAGSYYFTDATTNAFYDKTGHSTILVDGNAQSVMGTGTTEQVIGSELYSYIKGSAAGAYGNLLSKFDRHAIQINHNDKAYYVIIDDLAAAADHTYGWQMYNGAYDDVAINGNNVTVTFGAQTLNLSFAGAALDIEAVAHNLKDANGKDFVENTLVASSAKTKAHQFFTVISAGEAVAVTEYTDAEGILSAKINYSGNKYDYVMFNTNDGTQASILGIDGDEYEGYAAAGKTTLTYNGVELFHAASALDIAADANGWVILSDVAQEVKIAAVDGTVRYNGAALTAVDGYYTVSVEAGVEAVVERNAAAEKEIPVLDSYVDFDNADWNVNGNATGADGTVSIDVTNAGAVASKAFKAYKRELIKVSFDFAFANTSREGAYAALYFYKDEVSKEAFVTSKKLALTEDGTDVTISAQVPDNANIVELRFGTEMGATVAYTISNLEVKVTPKILMNESFDDGMYGWGVAGKLDNEGVEHITVVDGENGSKALKIESADKLPRSVKQTFEVNAYEAWTMTIRYKADALDAEAKSSIQVGIWFYKDKASNAMVPGSKTEYLYYKGANTANLKDTNGEWVTATVTAMVPGGANLAQVEFNNSSSQEIEYVVDYVLVEKTNTETYLYVEDFEDSKKVENTWESSNNWQSTPVAIYGPATGHDQFASMHMFMQGGGAWASSPVFEVTPDVTYTVDFQALKANEKNDYSGRVQFVFIDEDGEEYPAAATTLSNIVYNEMTAQSVSAIAPKNAVGAYVKFILGNAAGTYAVDDVKIRAGETNWVVNGDFENGKTNWKGSYAMSVVEDGDDHALNIPIFEPDANGKRGGAYWTSGTVSVKAGETYKLTLNAIRTANEARTEGTVKDSGDAYIGIWYTYVDGTIGSTSIRLNQDVWTEYELEWIVPVNVVSFYVEVGVNSNSGASFLIDDIVVKKLVSEGNADRELVFAEQFVKEATLIEGGWTAYDDFASTPVDVYTAYNSTLSLYFQKSGAWAKSPAFAVKAGNLYTAEVMTLRYTDVAYGGEAQFIFLDREDNVLKTTLAVAVATGATQANSTEKDATKWNAESFSAVAPKGAVKAQVIFKRTNSDYALDDLCVYNDGVASEDYELPNGDFSNGLDGWSLNNGAHINVFSGAAWFAPENSVDYMKRNVEVTGYDIWEVKLDYKWNFGTMTPYFGLWFYKDKVAYTYDEALGDFVDYRGSTTVRLTDTSGEWVTVSALIAVPADANLAVLEIGNSSGATGSYEVDNITMTKVGSPVFSDFFDYDILLPNTAVDKAMIPAAKGWTATNNFATNAVRRYTVANGWPNMLWFQDYADSASSPKFPVEAGKIYVTDITTYRIGSSDISGYAKYIFLNKAGEQVGVTTLDIGTGAKSEYTVEKLEAVAPEDAYTAYIEIGATNNNFGISDIAVYQHTDADKDHICDDCDAVLTECVDENNDHICDYCGETASVCVDENADLACDICGKILAEGTPLNGNFDYSDDVFAGWSATSAADLSSLALGQGVDGSNALLLKDPSTTAGGPEVFSPKFSVEAGMTYSLSLAVKKVAETEGTTALSVTVFFYDAEGNWILKEDGINPLTAGGKAAADNTEQWQVTPISFTVPENAVSADIRLLYTKSCQNTVLVDDVVVEHVCADENKDHVCDNGCDVTFGDHIDADGDRICDYGCRKYVGAIFEEYFENVVAYPYTTNDGSTSNNFQAVGWTTEEPNNIRVGVYSTKDYVGGTLYDGNYLFLMAKNFWARSPKFDVTAGNVYTMTFMDHWFNGAVGDGYAKIVFVNSADTEIGSETIATGVSETWTRLSLEATAPAGAVQAYIEFGVASDCTGNGYFGVDSVGVFEHAHVDENGDCVCDVCGAQLDHTFDADCDDRCNVCGEYRSETAAHNLTTHVEAVVPANCSETGHPEYWICGGCGAYFRDAEGTMVTNPAWINYNGDHVRPEGAVDCAEAPCEICGETTYGDGAHDVPTCTGGTCSKCGEEVIGSGHELADWTPLCQGGECVYCGEYVIAEHENGESVTCVEGYCKYGCGKTYPATTDHADDDGNDYCDNCWSHINHVDDDGDGYCDVCENEMPAAHEHVPGEAVKENVVDATCTEAGSYDL
ncbi:MAG: DUF4962 domain-containing protein, partial [Ruminococcaceae bacterium]|nr:DUF4962 domain-containing protein [Oscillospiraceae bacterium]